MNSVKTFLVVLTMLFSSVIYAKTSEDSVKYLQKQWAIVNYELSGKVQKDAFEILIETANKKVKDYPESAELYIWRGIIRSTYAGVKGGLDALKYARAARSDLEKALELNALALGGSAYTCLGSLYLNVPGWPISFGDDEKAEKLLKRALDINPDGIDSNYFYGDYLRGQGKYQSAEEYFLRAQQAMPRVGRELADAGRRKEVQQALLEIEKNL
jgi:tetratricopeptide (TPR) repeat protein